MKAKIKNLWAIVLAQLLSLLGFASCDEIIPARCEYGQPHVDYAIKGTVTDKSGKPIEGIRVAIHRKYPQREGVIYDNPVFRKDTLFTDKDGKVGYSGSDFTDGLADIFIEDVDGEENGGEFEEQIINNLEAKRTKKSDGWYEGAFEAEFKASLKKR